jgi:hypothetical protein
VVICLSGDGDARLGSLQGVGSEQLQGLAEGMSLSDGEGLRNLAQMAKPDAVSLYPTDGGEQNSG